MPGPGEPDRLIDEVTSAFDLTSDLGRREAYLRCPDYARDGLPGALARNDFVRRAAERLGQVAVRARVAADVAATSRERLHLAYSRETGPVLTGNREGLTWLARVLDQLARARTDGEHVRLIPGDSPLSGSSYALSLYVEPDGWRKEIRPDLSRMYVFEFRRDDGALSRLALDLDDERVEFLAGEDA